MSILECHNAREKPDRRLHIRYHRVSRSKNDKAGHYLSDNLATGHVHP